MSSPRVAPPLSGNVLGSVTDDFVIAEWNDPGGPPSPPRYIAPLHRHNSDDEAWYVLEGELRIQMDDEVIAVPAGASALVRKGVAHTYWNPGQGPTRYLLIMPPRICRLIQAIHALTERTPLALKKVFAEHDSELL